MWNLTESGVRTAGGVVHLMFTATDPAEVQGRAAELGNEGVRRRVLNGVAASPAVLRLLRLQQAYRDATAASQGAEATLGRLAAERAALVDSCQPGLGGRLVALDRQAAEAQAGAGLDLAALEPLLRGAHAKALAEVRAAQRGETARASAEATTARAEALARLAALPAEVQEHLTTICATALCSFAASAGAPLGGSAEALLAAALRQAAEAEGTGEPEPAQAEARAGTPVATMA